MPVTAATPNRKPLVIPMPDSAPSRLQRSSDALPSRASSLAARDLPIQIVAYRIGADAMPALKALPRGAFRVEEAERIEDVLTLTRPGQACDLVLVGCSVGLQDPPDRLEALRRLRPGQRIALLCANAACAGQRAVRLLNAGLSGIFPTTMQPAAMASAIRLVLDGGRFVPPEMLVPLEGAKLCGTADFATPGPAGDLVHTCRPTHGAVMDNPLALLSKREREVARLIARGLANKEIAYRLDLQEVTIKVHATSIYRKLGVRNRAQAVGRLLAAVEAEAGNA
jgi:DNA-binding NarL/FixJ family response regulator